MMEYEITPESLNNANASRKNDRVFLAQALTQIATRHGASVERRHTQRARGYSATRIKIRIDGSGGYDNQVDASGDIMDTV